MLCSVLNYKSDIDLDLRTSIPLSGSDKVSNVENYLQTLPRFWVSDRTKKAKMSPKEETDSSKNLTVALSIAN